MAHRTIKIKGITLTGVFRHRYEKRTDSERIFHAVDWRRWELGFWVRRNQMVGKKDFSDPKEWKNNMVYSYMVGIEFLWFRAWIAFDKNGMHL